MLQDISTDEENSPRLDPIEQPGSLFLKAAYWIAEKKFGKVITPLKVLYARFPGGLGLARSLVQLEKNFTIDKELQHLIQMYVATLNGCAFCRDINAASLEQHRVSGEKIDELMKFEESELFSESEKAALSYADEATRNRQVDTGTFNRLKNHFEEQEIVEITMINAVENFYNLMNAPLNIGSDQLCTIWQNEEG